MSRKRTKIVELSEENSSDGDYSVSEDDWTPNKNEIYTDSSDQFEDTDIADKTDNEITVKNRYLTHLKLKIRLLFLVR